jgi:hypothetical protein
VTEDWRDICEQIVAETDSRKLLELAKKANKAIAAEQDRKPKSELTESAARQ